MKKTLIFFILITYGLSTFAESATIKGIKIIPDSYQDGEEGILFKISFDVLGRKGKKQNVSLYFQYHNGNRVNCGNSGFHSTDGQLAVSGVYTPQWDNTTYTDYKIFMPYIELHKAGAKGEMNVKMIVWGEGKALCTYTSSSFKFSDNSIECAVCNQTGRCRICRGIGSMGNFPCVSCKGSAVCTYCKGYGETHIFSCYIPGNKSGTIPNPNIGSSSKGYVPRYNDSESSSNTKPTKYKQCTSCYGTGYIPHYSDGVFEDNYPYEWCPTCRQNHYNRGIHNRCRVCEGKGKLVDYSIE